MIHVKNTFHALRVKWMHCLCNDAGSSWSRFVWPDLSVLIPEQLWTGLCLISAVHLVGLDPFYSQMVCSFAMVNDLMYEHFDSSELPQNLWTGKVFVRIPIT